MDEPILKFPLADGTELELNYLMFKQVQWSFPAPGGVRGTLAGKQLEFACTAREWYAYVQSHELWPRMQEDFFIREPK